MEERLTLERTLVLSSETWGALQVTVNELKDRMNITFNDHDFKLEAVLKSVISAVESVTETTLITERDVNVAWQSFYDDEYLPYCPVKAGTTVTVQDLDGVEIDTDLYSLVDVGGFIRLIGDFPNGVKLSYTTQKVIINESQRLAILNIAALTFENPEYNIRKGVLSNIGIFRFK